jgi:hypothetical protein
VLVRDEQWCPAGEMKPSHIQKKRKRKKEKEKQNFEVFYRGHSHAETHNDTNKQVDRLIFVFFFFKDFSVTNILFSSASLIVS